MGIEAKALADAVDPFFGSFKFSKGSNGRLVEDAVTGSVGVLRSPFFVDESRLEAKLNEDRP